MTVTAKAKYLNFGARLVQLAEARNGDIANVEVLTHAEEIRGEVVVHEEIINLLTDFAVALVRVILQACPITHLGIELLAGGERLVILYLADDVVGHQIVLPPRYEFHSVGQCADIKAAVLTEHGAAVRHENGSGFGIRQQLHGRYKRKILHIPLTFLQR